MTVSTTNAIAGPYAGAGTVGPFTVNFRFLAESHLRVLKTSTAGLVTTLTLTTDYSVTGVGLSSGSVTLAVALAVGEKLTVLRNVPATQEVDYVQNDAFPAESHEMALDKLTMLVQQQVEVLGRTLRLPPGDMSTVELPAAIARAGGILAFDNLGNPTATIPNAQDATAVALALAQFITNLANAGSTSLGDALVGVQQPVSGPKARTQHDKNFDYVTSSDFAGIVPDANIAGAGTDSTAGLQAAINWCSANGRKLKLIGLVRITAALTYPGQICIEGEGDPQTYDSGIVYTGAATTMWQGAGSDVNMAFVKLKNLALVRPAALSNVRCLYGDFYQGGTDSCVFRGWGQAIECFGSINRHKLNRFVECDNGILVTNWPLTSSQPGQSTTTITTEENNFFGCTGKGLSLDSGTTGGGNILSCHSKGDIFEQNVISLYANKTFQFLVENSHFEGSVTWAIQQINSDVTYANRNLQGADAGKVSETWPGAAANMGGNAIVEATTGMTTRAAYFRTKNNQISGFEALDNGTLDLIGAGIVGKTLSSWVPAIGSSAGTSGGNTYTKQEGYYFRLGPFVIAPFVIYMSAKDAGIAGDLRVTGLPFTVGTQFNGFASPLRISNLTLSAGYTYPTVDPATGTNYAPIVMCGSNIVVLAMPAANLLATSRISGTIIYMAA